MAKQYKNVYTILEKVKKGEIKSYYTDKEGLFGKINFYRKPDLIKPHLHYIDEDRLQTIMDTYMSDGKTSQEYFQKFAKHTDYKKLDDKQKPDGSSYHKKFMENYKKFPKHIARDVFKMFYNRMERLDFEERTDSNYTKFKFLERANNPVGKIMTEHSNLKSAIFARNVLAYFVARMTQIEYVDPNMSKDLNNGLNAGNDFDNTGIDDALDKMFENAASKSMLEEAMQKAQDLCKQMDTAIPDDLQEKMFERANEGGTNGEAAKISPDYLRTITASLSQVRLSMGSLKEKIKKLLDKSVSYFSARKKVIFEDLLNSDNIAGLEEFEFLHPKIRNLFIEDINIKDHKSIGKIDIYIDISGSMSESCGVKDTKGNRISKIDFAKSFAAKLLEMDMLNDVYLFDTRVTKYRNDLVSISMIDANGGTTIDNAVRSIKNNPTNALVITDAEDSCSEYSEKAFFIGIKGASFHRFSGNVLEEYINKGQMVVFDGSNIQKVGLAGQTV